ncbi:hypothetical protein E4U32_007121, partial [Claviceps aff. humidiphila group G2b]
QNDQHIRRIAHSSVPSSGRAPAPDGPGCQGDGQRRSYQEIRGELVQDPTRPCGCAELVSV